MLRKQEEHWRELYAAIAREKDRQRLLKPGERLNKLLEKRKKSAGHPSS